ncbi:hypothetical protein [Caudovirales GX15bay]|nr:hypothetical protein [Caudovirales GX15bay]
MSTDNELKAVHDALMALKPEGEEHSCPLCAMDSVSNDSTGGFMPETFTQADLDAAVAAASSGLQQRLAELEAQVQETETGKAIAEAVAAKDSDISKLQEQLDAAEAARTAAEAQRAELEQFWTDAIAAHEAEATMAARRAERAEAARTAEVLSDEYIEKNADRFAAMSDEDFAARLEEWRLIASKTREGSSAAVPARSALVASRADDSKPTSSLGLIADLRTKGIDPRTLATGGM